MFSRSFQPFERHSGPVLPVFLGAGSAQAEPLRGQGWSILNTSTPQNGYLIDDLIHITAIFVIGLFVIMVIR
ncbi:MAG: hypothetical protein R3C68_15335 [Myxococcota bacterium]